MCALAVAIACGLLVATLEGGVHGDPVAWGRSGLVPGGPRLPPTTLGLRGGEAVDEKQRPPERGLDLEDEAPSQDSHVVESGGRGVRMSKRTRSPGDPSSAPSAFSTSRPGGRASGVSGSEIWWSGSESRTTREPRLGAEVPCIGPSLRSALLAR